MASVVGFFMVSGCYRTAAVSPMETVRKPPERFQDELSIHIYIYIHMCVYTYIYIYIYTQHICRWRGWRQVLEALCAVRISVLLSVFHALT